jgi:hypothetical protein
LYAANGKPICRPVHTGIFHSPEYLNLEPLGQARLVMLFLLIHPHGGTFHLPGLYHTGPNALRESMGLSRRIFLNAFNEMLTKKVFEHDERHHLIWMPCALRLVAPPINPNMVKGYCRSIQQLPPSPLVTLALPAYDAYLEQLGPSYAEPFRDAFGIIPEPFGNHSGIPSNDARHSNSYSNDNQDIHSNLYVVAEKTCHHDRGKSDLAAETKTAGAFSQFSDGQKVRFDD